MYPRMSTQGVCRKRNPDLAKLLFVAKLPVAISESFPAARDFWEPAVADWVTSATSGRGANPTNPVLRSRNNLPRRASLSCFAAFVRRETPWRHDESMV